MELLGRQYKQNQMFFEFVLLVEDKLRMAKYVYGTLIFIFQLDFKSVSTVSFWPLADILDSIACKTACVKHHYFVVN